MTSIFEITDWAHVASFFVWTLAVRALAKAIFGSFPAAELQYRLTLRDSPRRQQISRLNWEVANRMKWDRDVARGSPHAAAIRLTDEEVEARRRELQALSRSSFAWRAFTYFMGCFACQSFWTAAAVFAVTRGARDIAGWLFTAAACSGAAMLLSAAQNARLLVNPATGASTAGCRDCGR